MGAAQRIDRGAVFVAEREIEDVDIGGGMGQALNTASAMPAYTLSDRGTWLSFKNKGPLAVLVELDAR